MKKYRKLIEQTFNPLVKPIAEVNLGYIDQPTNYVTDLGANQMDVVIDDSYGVFNDGIAIGPKAEYLEQNIVIVEGTKTKLMIDDEIEFWVCLVPKKNWQCYYGTITDIYDDNDVPINKFNVNVLKNIQVKARHIRNVLPKFESKYNEPFNDILINTEDQGKKLLITGRLRNGFD